MLFCPRTAGICPHVPPNRLYVSLDVGNYNDNVCAYDNRRIALQVCLGAFAGGEQKTTPLFLLFAPSKPYYTLDRRHSSTLQPAAGLGRVASDNEEQSKDFRFQLLPETIHRIHQFQAEGTWVAHRAEPRHLAWCKSIAETESG